MENNEVKRLIDVWEEYDENHPANSYLRGDAEFAGPVRKRRCTDLLFLVIFITMNIGLGYLSYIVINEGAPVRLSRGYDFRGAVCGQGGLSHIPYMYWPDPYDINFSLCVSACPVYYIRDYFCVYKNDHVTLLTDWCWDTIESTTYGYYCIPIFKEYRVLVINYLFDAMQLFKRSIGDLTLAWDPVMLGIGLSIIVAFSYLIFFRFKLYLFYVAYQLSYNQLCKATNGGLDPEYCYTPPSDGLLYTLFFLCLLTILYPIVILSKVKAIKLSIGIIKLATQPFYTLKQIFFYPLMQLFFGALVLGFLLLVIVYTMSTGVISLIQSGSIPGGKSKIIEYTATEKYFLICNVVMSLWWISFLIAFSEFILSAAVSVWYFTRERSSLYFPLWRGFKLIVRYHLGSVVRGSLFSTLFKFPIFVLENVKSLAALCRHTKPGCTDCILKSCYCLKCHQKWLRYFSKYSYIFLALFGEDYYDAARKSFYLINRNRNRIFVPAKAGDFGMLIIKLSITLSGTALAYSLVLLPSTTLSGQATSQLVAPVFIGLVSVLVSAYIAQIFGGAMQACMNTIIICGACDEEMFTREQRFMYPELRDYLDQIYEEMTEQQREHKEIANMNSSKKVYQKTKILDEGAESTSVMRPFFNQGSEISAPVKALNIDDLDEDNLFVSKPNIIVNQNFESSFRENSGNVHENTMKSFLQNNEKSFEPASKSFLDPTNKNYLNKSQLNTSGIKDNKSFLNPKNINNYSVIERVNPLESRGANDRTALEVRNFLSPVLGKSSLVSREALNRSVQPRHDNQSKSFMNQNNSFVEVNKTWDKVSKVNMGSSVRENEKSFEGNSSFGGFFNHENSFGEEDPIQVYNESSIEMEPDEGRRPNFQR